MAALPPVTTEPRRTAYDVVIVGGAIVGSSIAWFLSANPDFDGSVLVVERDPTYSNCSTAHTNSCMRQQFSTEVNIAISQFGARFVREFRDLLGDDPEIPEIFTHHYGYMYLSADHGFAAQLAANQQLQASLGASTEILGPDELARRYPFYNVDDILCGSHNTVDEGYFDGNTMFQWLRRMARANGVEYLTGTVTDLERTGDRVSAVHLDSGHRVESGVVVNATGTRASSVAAMVGIDVPVEPRKRFTFIFDAQDRLDRPLPLTIDPSGVHVRDDGLYYLAGCPPDLDAAVDHGDFAMDRDIWEEKVWPAIAHRIPAFERVKVVQSWAGHYAYNTLDQNAIIGPHTELENFVFASGFSGHGLQQSPATGCAVSEWITYGEYRTIDVTELGFARIAAGEPFRETAII